MKKSTILMALAFVLAISGAIASKANTKLTTYYKIDPSDPTSCITQTACTLSSGQACTFQAYSNTTCTTAITLFRP